MNETNELPPQTFVKTVTNWHAARIVFSEFISAHPELGLKDSPTTFRNFCSRHGRALMQQDVMRKPTGLRSPAIFDSLRFDGAAFELMTKKLLPSCDVIEMEAE
jgi:hypothetical protein